MNNYFLSSSFALILLTASPCASLAANIIVDTDQDSLVSAVDDKCSLREAIEAANTNLAVDTCSAGDASSVDDIRFFIPSPATITLEGQLLVSGDTRIYGFGSSNLTIDADSADRHFRIGNSAVDSIEVSIGHMRLINGFSPSNSIFNSGGSIFMLQNQQLFVDTVVFEDNISRNGGGAINLNNETGSSGQATELTILRSVFRNSEAQGPASGGAIRLGTGNVLNVTDSTFSRNSATHENGGGGGILAQSNSLNPTTIDIERSTFNGNTANASGGAISATLSLQLTIVDTTIVGNTADNDGVGSGDFGGGISMRAGSSLSLQNTILAGNKDSSNGPGSYPDINISDSTVSFISNGYNFIGTNDWNDVEAIPGTPRGQDFIGTNANPLNPNLLALADNGGATPTMAIPDPNDGISLVLDSGNCVMETSDQRGFSTDIGSGSAQQRAEDIAGVEPLTTGGNNCDIGSFELGAKNQVGDQDYDGIQDGLDDCPNHFNPSQNQVCDLGLEQSNVDFCVPIKSTSGAVAVICL